MLITVDYFLTTAISAVSGFQYIGSVVPVIDAHILILACGGIIVLTVLNIIGIRESAAAALLMAICAFVMDLIVIGASVIYMSADQWAELFHHLNAGRDLSVRELLTGFGAAWLAFSGLESISQISPAMRLPCAEPRATPWPRW
jgi:amino acid transporter